MMCISAKRHGISGAKYTVDLWISAMIGNQRCLTGTDKSTDLQPGAVARSQSKHRDIAGIGR